MPTDPLDPFNLQRFLAAQATDYATALAELQSGRKRSHWIWYVFPQWRGLGSSTRSAFYGIACADEARAYLAHPVLGPRLRECVRAMESLHGLTASDVLGPLDALKFRSCLTLFASVVPDEPLFRAALDRHFDGAVDERTMALLCGLPPAA